MSDGLNEMINKLEKKMASEKTDLALTQESFIDVLRSSLYPGASTQSIQMALGYCKAAGLDPMTKPVHIVNLWDSKSQSMRDVIMPGIGLYRIQAARSGEYAGVSEPEFGPDVITTIGGQQITYPAWCKVTVKRLLKGGEIATFTAQEFWKENYATRGGKDKSIAPNAMWAKRPYGQLNKCSEAQALRKAFPEFGSQPTSDEMEGKPLFLDEPSTPQPIDITHTSTPADEPRSLDAEEQERILLMMHEAATRGTDALKAVVNDMPVSAELDAVWKAHKASLKELAAKTDGANIGAIDTVDISQDVPQ